MASSFVTYVTYEITKNKYYWELKTPILGIDPLKFCICDINEFVQKLLENISIFYCDDQLGVNFITLEPLLAGNK